MKTDRVPIPTWLRLWLALQVVSFAIAPLLWPATETVIRSLVWTMIMLAIGWAMWRRSKAAWIAALVLATWSIYTSLAVPLIHDAWVIWPALGLIGGLAEFVILLSPQARRWINGPNTGPPIYAGSDSRSV